MLRLRPAHAYDEPVHLSRILVAGAATSLLAAPAAGAATKPLVKKSATYRGATSQGSTCRSSNMNDRPCDVSVKTSSDGKRVKLMLIRFSATCENTNLYRNTTDFANYPISRKGGYSEKGSYTQTIPPDNVRAEHDIKMKGRFYRDGTKYRLKGTFSVDADLTFQNGQTTRCTTGTISWSAKP
jgi:hypothetical protein